jgi:Methyltransferase domain
VEGGKSHVRKYSGDRSQSCRIYCSTRGRRRTTSQHLFDRQQVERDRACKDYLARPEHKARVHLLVADSHVPLPNLRFGFLFIDGDHTFEGVLADVVAHWNALQASDEKPALVAFHDGLPNQNFKWRDADRNLNRLWIPLKNKFRKRQKPEIAPDYEPGVLKVCDELIHQGLAAKWRSASSMLVMEKLAELPRNFSVAASKLRLP